MKPKLRILRPLTWLFGSLLGIVILPGCAASKPTVEDLLATAKTEFTRGNPSEASRYCRKATRGLDAYVKFKAVDGDFFAADASISGQESKIYFFIRKIEVIVHPSGEYAYANLTTNYVTVSGPMRSAGATMHRYNALYREGRWEMGIGEIDGKSRHDMLRDAVEKLGIDARNGGARSFWEMPMEKIQSVMTN